MSKIKLQVKKLYCNRHKWYLSVDKFTLQIDGTYKRQCDNCLEHVKQYGVKYRRGYDIDNIIMYKIGHSRELDKRRNYNYDEVEYISLDFIKELIKKNGNMCKYCLKTMKFTSFEKNDPDQFTINRIVNYIPHLKINCELCCWFCNRQKQ